MNSEIDNSVLEYLKSLTLLCVEDNKTTQLIYNSIFEELVGEIIFSYNGEDGYQKFTHNHVDLIISDYDMPILDGISMIEKIRAVNKDIPIILVTAIQEVDVIVKALQLNVNNFLKKPIKPNEVMLAIENVSKILIADKYLKEQREKRLKQLEDKEEYNIYQEDLAFSKELNILRNDFYYQMVNNKYHTLVDFYYKPLDVLSGDAYSARRVDDSKTFYVIIDGMGKGLSASLSAMLMTSYVNHIIDISEFNFTRVISDCLEYIKPILLDEETLSVDFYLLDYDEDIMHYAKFSMPPSLLQTDKNEVIKIKSNNPPISKYMKKFDISPIDISNIIKFLFYSDGMTENSTRFGNKLYMNYIEDDFLESFTKEDMRSKFLWKIDTQEDDITFIYIHKIDSIDNTIATQIFDTKLEEVENASEWYTNVWENLTDNQNVTYSAGVVFSELFMNAYEHGNLGIDAGGKHILLENNTYFSTLEAKEKNCTKKISVSIDKIIYMGVTYIISTITDEGRGFDTKILSRIFRDMKTYNGRGVFVSRRSSLGIYYNSSGNSVLYMHKL